MAFKCVLDFVGNISLRVQIQSIGRIVNGRVNRIMDSPKNVIVTTLLKVCSRLLAFQRKKGASGHLFGVYVRVYGMHIGVF